MNTGTPRPRRIYRGLFRIWLLLLIPWVCVAFALHEPANEQHWPASLRPQFADDGFMIRVRADKDGSLTLRCYRDTIEKHLRAAGLPTPPPTNLIGGQRELTLNELLRERTSYDVGTKWVGRMLHLDVDLEVWRAARSEVLQKVQAERAELRRKNAERTQQRDAIKQELRDEKTKEHLLLIVLPPLGALVFGVLAVFIVVPLVMMASRWVASGFQDDEAAS